VKTKLSFVIFFKIKGKINLDFSNLNGRLLSRLHDPVLEPAEEGGLHVRIDECNAVASDGVVGGIQFAFEN
jgi:hypothetical protein